MDSVSCKVWARDKSVVGLGTVVILGHPSQEPNMGRFHISICSSCYFGSTVFTTFNTYSTFYIFNHMLKAMKSKTVKSVQEQVVRIRFNNSGQFKRLDEAIHICVPIHPSLRHIQPPFGNPSCHGLALLYLYKITWCIIRDASINIHLRPSRRLEYTIT